MTAEYLSSVSLPDFSLWEKLRNKRFLVSFELEITARCNNNCSHCYINLPVDDKTSEERELSFYEINEIADEAFSLGAIWCLITGGEPLLRPDFQEIYVALKRKGFLISVFTNANLITNEHIKLFRRYPPRDIEVTVYGMTKATYERVTRKPGSFEAFIRGLRRLTEGGIKVRLKAMALRSNMNEMPIISKFCRQFTKDLFRFDPILHLRYDGNKERNKEIISERLSVTEILSLELSDKERYNSLNDKWCYLYSFPNITIDNIFCCGTGNHKFSVSYDGIFRPCSSLWHPDCIYDLRQGTVTDAWNFFVPLVRDMKHEKEEYSGNCSVCNCVNFCYWCPAHAYLETGDLHGQVNYFCEITKARNKFFTRSKDRK